MVLVTYNSYDELFSFLDSISKAKEMCSDEFELEVIVADNSNVIKPIDSSIYENLDIKIFNYKNVGYIGAAASILNPIIELSQYKYVVISNVDLKIDNSFFKNLIEYDCSNVGWIAPMIVSMAENRDKNPKIITRYSLFRLKVLRMMYKYPILHYLYTHTFYRRKKYVSQTVEPKNIYAGHGALMIFSGKALQDLLPINYPIFLFGEELFFAEELMKRGYKVHYDPSIRVYDLEHASTGKMKNSDFYKYNYDAINYIIQKYYE